MKSIGAENFIKNVKKEYTGLIWLGKVREKKGILSLGSGKVSQGIGKKVRENLKNGNKE